MTLFLASVCDAGEAETALRHGADIIDAKDPSTSALGALAPAKVRDIVAVVAGRRPVSAVLDDLRTGPAGLAAAADMAATGVTYLKAGLFPGADHRARIEALAPVAALKKLIGVMFADAGPDIGLLGAMAAAGFHGVMIDTAGKEKGRLLTHVAPPGLAGYVDAARAAGLTIGFAGSLEPPDIPRLLPLGPDYLGFRGALCGPGGRGAPLDAHAVEIVRGLIAIERRDGADIIRMPTKVDYRVLAASLFFADPKTSGATSDRLFVHDFVLPIRIGAYAFEREQPQRVRFNVDVDIERLDHMAEDLRDVLSYDLITDGIAMIVAVEHIELVETLAERVAALVLRHARVTKVTVRVEKLDLRPGSVGVEIVRERPPEVASVHPLAALAEGGPKRPK